MTGLVVKAYCGYYDVVAAGARSVCKTRGTQDFPEVFVGDQVEIVATDPGKAVITKVMPRTTLLEHPQCANITQAVIVVSLHNPVVSFLQLDRFLVLAQSAGVVPIICVNKADLISTEEKFILTQTYAGVAPIIYTSVVEHSGLIELQQKLQGQVSVLAGVSGVGKSSLLNALVPHGHLKTAAVSEKNKHGKHTTRFVELLAVNDTTYVLDSPGFSNIQQILEKTELGHYFPDIQRYATDCRFQGCLHDAEPDCAVREAFRIGVLSASRFTAYTTLLQEALQHEKMQYKRQFKQTYRKGTNKKWRS